MKSFATVLVVVLALLLAACGESDLIREAHPTTLVGSAWRVVAVNGRPPIAGSEPTAIFAATDVKGSAGCNSYGGRYSYDPSTGAIYVPGHADDADGRASNLPVTMIEGLFTGALNQATSASIDPEGRLVLSGPGGEILLAVDAVTQ